MKWVLLVSLFCDPCSSADHNIQWIKAYATQTECKTHVAKDLAELKALRLAAGAPEYPMIWTCLPFTVTKP